MSRVGTLLDEYGRPEDRVQIIRRGKNATRIRRSTDHGRSWSAEDGRVDTSRILEDGIAYLRHGDALHVASTDRLARCLVDPRGIIDQITVKGASVHLVKEHLMFSAQSTDPRPTFMLGVLSSFAEFERSIIWERQAEGHHAGEEGRQVQRPQTSPHPRQSFRDPPAGQKRVSLK